MVNSLHDFRLIVMDLVEIFTLPSTPVDLMKSITTREDHAQPADKEPARYISPPKTNFIMQQAKQMQTIDSKDEAWISKMVEVTQNLSTKYFWFHP